MSVDTVKDPSMQYGHDNVALRTTYIKSVKLKIIKMRISCQYIDYLCYSENLSWVAKKTSTGPRVGHSWYRACKRNDQILRQPMVSRVVDTKLQRSVQGDCWSFIQNRIRCSRCVHCG